MMAKEKWGIAKRIVLPLILTIVISSGVYYATQVFVLDRAERSVQSLILSHRALHEYIQKEMHPTFYAAVAAGSISENYYAPEIFSSSYIVRLMHGFYNEELQKYARPEIYYKLAAKSPRNPVNQADAFEEELISRFNEDRKLKGHRQIMTVDGEKYLYYAIPFIENTSACMRCHGKREDAPAGLQALYPGNGGFNEQIGQIRAIESIRVPLHADYEALYVVLAVIGSVTLSLLGLYLFNTRLRSEVDAKTSRLQEELQARTEAENALRAKTAALENEIAERQKTQEALYQAKEDAETANRAKTAFLSNMSHELRTPLNGVVGMAELIGLTEVSPEQKRYLHILQRSADDLLILISDILDITKIEAEEFELNQVEFSVRKCVGEVVLMQQTPITQKGLCISTSVAEAIPDNLLGDKPRIFRILTNLLSNAIKFTEEGSITIAVTISEQYDSTILLDFAVTDTGIGIAPEWILNVFNPFTQADDSTTRKHGGAGIGLANSRKLAILLGGDITVESQLHEGSCFHLLLPFMIPSCPDKAAPERLESIPPLIRRTETPSVLVAEDNPANQRYAQKLMEQLGYQVTVAADGEKALEAWQNNHFDLILMDIQMPKINGDEVVKRIRRDAKKTNIPIIAVTAHALVGDKERLIEIGCNGYISKPFQMAKLAAEVTRVIGNTP